MFKTKQFLHIACCFDGAKSHNYPRTPLTQSSGIISLFAENVVFAYQSDPDRCHASPDYPTELFSISKGGSHDLLFEDLFTIHDIHALLSGLTLDAATLQVVTAVRAVNR